MKSKNQIKRMLLIITSSTCLSLQAQEWNTAGNAATDPTVDFVGTTDAQPLVFRTNNQERFRISAAGSFGFGTNNPLSLLHLNTTTTGSLFRTDGAAANTNRWRLYTGSIEKFQLRIPGNSNNVILQSSNASPIVSGSQGGPGHLFFGTAGVLRLKINGTFDVAGTPQYQIGTYNSTNGVNTSGYMLLNSNPASALNNLNNGAWSLLHLNGNLI